MRSADSPSHQPEASLLQTLATRVRAMREARGFSRATLAERSGLSVRFLARIESGEGNVSLVRLSHLADALGTSLEYLLRAEDEPSPVVVLVGMRGAGKSTVGPILARRLAIPFVEMDRLIEEACGLPVDQIFELHGERYYRRVERQTLGRILLRNDPVVIAAAGGVVTEPATWELLLERASVVWLRADPEDHWNRVIAQGDRRPMADNPDAMAELRAMLAAREELYRRSHLVVDTSSLTPERIAERIDRELGREDASR